MKFTDQERQLFSKLGKKGGHAVSLKYGKEHYRKLAENMNKKKKEKRAKKLST